MEEVRVLRGPERRRATRFFVVRERRSGFERRSRRRSRLAAELDTTLVYLRDHPATLAVLLILGNMLSLADLAFTQVSLSLGAAEANPLMRHVLAAHPAYAAVLKIGVVMALSLVIWRFRRRRRIVGLAVYLVAFYCLVVAYELVGVGRLL